jgi:hypothetical protein
MFLFSKKSKKQNPAKESKVVVNQNASEKSEAAENKTREVGQGDKLKVYNLIILDKSGSMGSIAEAAISGFNETVGGIRAAQERYKDSQEHLVSLLVFCNCDKTFVYENVLVSKVKELTSKDYRPCCGTPLYDAMGLSLNRLYKQIKNEANSTAVVTVITDGLENASREYSGSAIKALVDKLKEEEGWNFAYIGANQDVERVGSMLSIGNTMEFMADEEGMRMAWEKERRAKMAMYDRMSIDAMECHEMSSIERKHYRARRNCEERNYRRMEEFADRITPNNISALRENEIFVFGSNLEGMHAGGAARTAVEQFGAVIGQGVGLQGQSYAIPTMQGGVETIEPYVREFFRFADQHPELTFLVTRVGCGIAGFTDSEIAPLFVSAIHLPNVHLPKSFWEEIV